MAENLVTFTLIDLKPIITDQNYHDENTTNLSTLIRMLKQQFRSKPTIAFSNNFEKIGEILLNDDDKHVIYDARISHGGAGGVGYSPIIVVLSEYSFVFVDYSSHEIKCKIKSNVAYLALEENYDGLGNDALLMRGAGFVLKYDLKQYIEQKEECKPLWTYTTENEATETINCMKLNGERVVVVKEGFQIKFLNSRTGMDINKDRSSNNFNISLEVDIDSCVEVDCFKPNTLYFIHKKVLRQYEYVNGNWIGTEHAVDVTDNDGLFMDRKSGLLYVSSTEGVSVYSTKGEFVKKEFLSFSTFGLCIDERTGLMYTCGRGPLIIMR